MTGLVSKPPYMIAIHSSIGDTDVYTFKNVHDPSSHYVKISLNLKSIVLKVNHGKHKHSSIYMNGRVCHKFISNKDFQMEIMYNQMLCPNIQSYTQIHFDLPMVKYIQYIIQIYIESKITQIQALYRGHRVRKRFNLEKLRLLTQIQHLPPKYIHCNFPGGTSYHKALFDFHKIIHQ